jgi:predicted phage tail protein
MSKRRVFLHGHLGAEFGEVFDLEISTAGEALRAFNANFPGRFIEVIKEGSYHLIRGDLDEGMGLEEVHLNTFNLGNGDLHIVPAVAGSSRSGKGGGGAIKAVLGIALIGVAIFMSGGLAGAGLAGFGAAAFSIGGLSVTWGNIALFGVAMALSGVSQMLSPKDKPRQETARDESFSFAGPINTNEQGSPVPLIYGRVMTGGHTVSSGIDIENIGAYASNFGSGVPGFGQAFINGSRQIIWDTT